MDIFVPGEEFHLFKLLCKILYDIRIDAPGIAQVTVSTLIHKRCGVQFDRITPKHKKQLEEFLSEHTVGVLNNISYIKEVK